MLGGTSFVGRAIVEDLLARQHSLTLFNRGRTGPDLFPGVPRLVGDRETGDYAALVGQQWDAVVDVCGFVPRHVDQALNALAGGFARYLFISTGMVYDHTVAEGQITEASPRLAAQLGEDLDDDSYGPLKVACEDVLSTRLGESLTVVRPGYVVGPHERAGLLTYWTRRATQARTAVPARLDRPAQIIDVRDLARLVTRLLEDDRPGAYNAVGPSPAVSFVDVVTACGDAELVQVPEAGIDFPLLFEDPAWDAMLRISPAAALGAGMPSTPLAETVAATRAWDQARNTPPLGCGLSDEEEQAALAAGA